MSDNLTKEQCIKRQKRYGKLAWVFTILAGIAIIVMPFEVSFKCMDMPREEINFDNFFEIGFFNMSTCLCLLFGFLASWFAGVAKYYKDISD